MNKNKQYILDHEIDLKTFFKYLIKKKILIISISSLFMVAGYFYSFLQPKKYKLEFQVTDARPYLFDKYNYFRNSEKSAQEFNFQFKLKLKSIDSIDDFFKENNKIDDYKSYINNQNSDIVNYFQLKLGQTLLEESQKNYYSSYFITFEKSFPAYQFINDYVAFVKKKAENEFKFQIKIIITNEMKHLRENLNIAEKLNLDSPSLNFRDYKDDLYKENILYSYNHGSKALSQRLNYLESILKELEGLQLDYSPIFDKQQTQKLLIVSKSDKYFAIVSFLLSFAFSIMIIFIKFTLQDESKLKT